MYLRTLIGLCVALAGSGCLSIYEPDVQQGNVVDQEMIDKLKPGMTRSQVRFVLGTPLIIDPFHPDRWDYVYFYKKNADSPSQTRHLAVFFNGDSLSRLAGDLVAAPQTPTGERAPSPTPADPASHTPQP